MKSINKKELLDKYFWGECTQQEVDYLFELALTNEDVKNELQLNSLLRKKGHIDRWESSPLPDDAKRLFKQYEIEGIGEPEKITDPELLSIIEDGRKEIAEIEDHDQKSKPASFKIVLIFIITSILFGVFYYYILKPQFDVSTPKTPIALFEKNLEHSKHELGLKGISEYKILESGLKKYSEKNYEEAAVDLATHYSKFKEDTESAYYLGRCYLHLNQPTNAINIFQKIKAKTTVDDFQFYDDSIISLGLAYLSSNDSANALKTLKEIANRNDKAKVLINEINNMQKAQN